MTVPEGLGLTVTSNRVRNWGKIPPLRGPGSSKGRQNPGCWSHRSPVKGSIPLDKRRLCWGQKENTRDALGAIKLFYYYPDIVFHSWQPSHPEHPLRMPVGLLALRPTLSRSLPLLQLLALILTYFYVVVKLMANAAKNGGKSPRKQCLQKPARSRPVLKRDILFSC